MRRAFQPTLAIALLALVACGPSVGKPAARATSKPTGVTSTATPRPASPSPGPTPTHPPTATPAPVLLARPTGEVKLIAGVVRIDATYALAAGAKLVSNNGAAVLSAGGTLVANNSGNLVSNNGGAILSDHGTGYRLTQADAKAGEILPAAGMVVTVRSLADGELLPLGTDPAGQPVYEVLTNALGGFELYLPANTATLLVETRFPKATGKAASDPRLAYDLVSDVASDKLVIDEDTALVTRYARQAWTETILKFCLVEDSAGLVREISTDASYKEVMIQTIADFRAIAKETGLDKAPEASARAAAARISDALIARVALSEIKLSSATWSRWQGPEEPAIPALVDVLRQMREAIGAKLAVDPGYFAQQAYVQEVNARRAPLPPYEIRKAADLNELIINEYLATNRPRAETDVVFTSMGVGLDLEERMYAAVNAYIAAVMAVLIADPQAKETAYDLLRNHQP